MKNKKGFTLVELLAVIVILALIMSIAVISISGVLSTARVNTFKETGASIIDGVKKQLLVNNKLDPGDYTFTSGVLEKAVDPPFGTAYNIQTEACEAGTQVGESPVCKHALNSLSCGQDTVSFVRIDGEKVAKICLTTKDGSGYNKYINLATEAQLLGNTTTGIILPS